MSYIEIEIDHPDYNRDGKVGILEVYFDPIATSEDGGYAENIEIEFNGKTICIDDLPASIAAQVENEADAWVNERAHELYYEAQIARAEAAYDAMMGR